MSPASHSPLLPPLRDMPEFSVRRRLQRASAVREQLRRLGYELAAQPAGDTVFVVMPRGQSVPPDIAALIQPHRAALLALLQRPEECAAVLALELVR